MARLVIIPEPGVQCCVPLKWQMTRDVSARIYIPDTLIYFNLRARVSFTGEGSHCEVWFLWECIDAHVAETLCIRTTEYADPRRLFSSLYIFTASKTGVCPDPKSDRCIFEKERSNATNTILYMLLSIMFDTLEIIITPNVITNSY